MRRATGAVVAALLFLLPTAATAEVREPHLRRPAFDPHAEGLIPIGKPSRDVPFRKEVSVQSLVGRHQASMLRMSGHVSAVTGAAKLPVALVDFTDHPAERTLHSPAAYDSLLFQDGYPYGAGSMRDYFQDQSGGLFDVDGSVSPWTVMPRTLSTYAGDSYGLSYEEPWRIDPRL